MLAFDGRVQFSTVAVRLFIMLCVNRRTWFSVVYFCANPPNLHANRHALSTVLLTGGRDGIFY